MRTIEELRERLIDSLKEALDRPGIYDQGIEEFFEHTLKQICWIDEREERLQQAQQCIPNRLHLSITRQLASQNFNWPNYGNEVNSVYAQVVHELAYWQASNLLGPSDWGAMLVSLDETFFERDWTEAEVLAKFGPASCSFWGGFETVHAYAPSIRGEPWVYFDFVSKLRPAKWEPRLAEPLLRDVRKQGHTMLPLPCARQNLIGRETIEEVHWKAVEPRLQDYPDRDTADIVAVIAEVRRRMPNAIVQRIIHRHHCCTAGVWCFSWTVGGREVRISSLVGFAPFSLVVPQHPPAIPFKDLIFTNDEAVDVVVEHLERFARGGKGM